MLPMKHHTPALSVVVALWLTACSGGGQASSSGAPSSTAIAAAPTTTPSSTATATSTATPAATASANKPARKAPKNYAALQAELAKKCPVAEGANNIEQKEAFAKSIECQKKKMTADLDAVLLPLKASEPAKYSSLMKEQAEWNRAIDKACALEEERMWVDFATGQRDDGTYRGYTYMGCYSQAYTERTMYARSLGAGKIGPLVKHIEETQKTGAEVKDAIADIQKRSLVFQGAPPAVEDGFSAPDWKGILDEAGHVMGATKTMAKSTCETWPDLEKALGGKEKCLAKAELYYYVQGNSPTVSAGQ